jgi:hypothetical protein
MKTLIKSILFFLSTTYVHGQTTPVLENFDSTSNWTFTNGAGIQEYFDDIGGYASFNVNDESYPNNSLITITSPEFQFECESPLVVEFPLSGRIEEFDTLFFQYKENNEWLTKDWYTSVKDITPSYNFSPFTTQFRFVLKTDSAKIRWVRPNLTDQQLFPDEFHPIEIDISNSYVGRVGDTREILVYYYDIDFFKIDCVEPLPIELGVFNGTPYAQYNELEWITYSETNNDKFIIQRSQNAVDFIDIGTVKGNGTTSVTNFYVFLDNTPPLVSYYKLVQKDFNGKTDESDIIVVIRDNGMKKLVKIINLMGQEVDENYRGVKVYLYSDGSVVKKYHQNLN